jgi:small subunit ribosomal protein S6
VTAKPAAGPHDKETDMSRIYEIMYVLDNNLVRAGWKDAKAAATGLIAKHGGKVLAARRWDERKLAYPIRQRRRGTYLLAYGEIDPSGVAGLRRELDLTESVLRYLILSAESVPAQELELTQAESAEGFVVPPPPEEASDAEPEEEESEEQAELEAAEVPSAELAGEEV